MKNNSANNSQSNAVTQVSDVQNQGSAPGFTSVNAHASPANQMIVQNANGVNGQFTTELFKKWQQDAKKN